MDIRRMKLYVALAEVQDGLHGNTLSQLTGWQRDQWQYLNELRVKEENALREKQQEASAAARGESWKVKADELAGKLVAAQKEVASLKSKYDALLGEYKEALRHVEVLRAEAKVATASRSDVWFWHPEDGDKQLEGFTCPVVMSIDTLLDLLVKAKK